MWWKGGSPGKPESWICCDNYMISIFLTLLQWCNDTKVENAEPDLAQSMWNPQCSWAAAAHEKENVTDLQGDCNHAGNPKWPYLDKEELSAGK